MEKPIETSSVEQRIYQISDTLKISLNVKKSRYNIDCRDLFKMSARENKKRDFIFVSRVIGKHIPICPYTLKLIGAVLARLWVEDREEIVDINTDVLVQAFKALQSTDIIERPAFLDSCKVLSDVLKNSLDFQVLDKIINTPIKLKNNTLFIGFAETATGLAQAVFQNFSNAAYIHTTRENINTIKESVFFKEEHSHATDHKIFPLNSNLFNEYEDIVLVDDELTTGKTAVNLISTLPGKSFGIISILDWRSEDNLNMFQQITDKKIIVSSLIKGTIDCEKTGETKSEPAIEISKSFTVQSKDITFKLKNNIEGYSKFTGRFGLISEENEELQKELLDYSSILKKERVPGNCLCIGTGEFIYIPCAISSFLGDNVFFQSTTRSPIHSKLIEDYGIKNKVQFTSSEDCNIKNYLYNLPYDFYSQVFFFSEKELDFQKKEDFKRLFSNFNIRSIIFVSWN